MTKNKKGSGFGLGMLMGALGGAVAALFFTPATGKENRKMAAREVAKVKKAIKGKKPAQIAKMAQRVIKKEVKKVARKTASSLNKATRKR